MEDHSHESPPHSNEPGPGGPPPVTIKAPSAESIWGEMVIAFNYLTRLNFNLSENPKPRLIRRSMSWFPLIGAIIGIFGAGVDWTMTQIGLPSLITATFAVLAMLWATRALHEEELASLVDQYSQAMDKTQRIGWLKEERSVRYGTLGVILVIIMKIGAIASLNNSDLVFQALIAACAWSRALMVLAAAWLRPVQGDPVADYFQQPASMRVVLALFLGAALNFAVMDDYALWTLGTGLASGLMVALVGAHHLRGYSGPLLGTLQQVVEVTVLGIIVAAQ